MSDRDTPDILRVTSECGTPIRPIHSTEAVYAILCVLLHPRHREEINERSHGEVTITYGAGGDPSITYKSQVRKRLA